MPGHVSVSVEELEAGIQRAKEENLFMHWDRRSGMKLPQDAGKIAVCLPIGPKETWTVHECRKCGSREATQDVLAHGLVSMEFLQNTMSIVPPIMTGLVYYARKSVPSARAREEMTHEAIKEGCSLIFYWDDDTILPAHAIYDMHAIMMQQPDVGIVTGVYASRHDVNEPVMYKHPGQGAYWDFTTKRGYTEDIYAAGAGCMMARVSALQDAERLMGRPWWDDEIADPNEGGKLWGHDIRFCDRMHKTAAQYKADADIGFMSKDEAMRMASVRLSNDLPPESNPEVANVANEILKEARELRAKKLIEAGSPVYPWRVTLAGWNTCGHYDYKSQTMYGIPADAPCFADSNTQGYWDKTVILEEAQGRMGSASRRGSEAWLHPHVADLIDAGSSVVDIGCYRGDLGDRLIKTKQCKYFGVDISRAAVEATRRRYMHADIVNLRDMEFEPQEPIVFTCLEVLEHLQPEVCDNTLKQMARLRSSRSRTGTSTPRRASTFRSSRRALSGSCFWGTGST
ncbi:MAG: class I SAM-dependent methyltransferase [Dehalococcoidia bacterium]